MAEKRGSFRSFSLLDRRVSTHVLWNGGELIGSALYDVIAGDDCD